MEAEGTELTYRACGGAARLFLCNDPEVLFEGPAGTGKSRGAMEKLNWLCEMYPGMRVLVARATRKSMTESILVTYENKVLWQGHPVLAGSTCGRANRDSYTYPNGSEIVIGGLDNPDRIMSTEYDVVYVPEATETSLTAWEKLLSRLRNQKIPKGVSGGPRKMNAAGEWLEPQAMEPDPRTGEPKPAFWTQALADCNPDYPEHWLNVRASPASSGLKGAGLMTRVKSRHEDNPSVTEGYLRTLRSMTGTRRQRLYEGLWVRDSASCVFNVEQVAKHKPKPGMMGDLRDDWRQDPLTSIWDTSKPVEWVPGQAIEGGTLEVWALPEPQTTYVMGHDHSYGINDKDYCLVANAQTGEIVAELIACWGDERWNRYLARLHYFYNMAFSVGERQVGLSHMRALLDFYSVSYQYYQRSEDKQARPKRDVLGWSRTGNDLAMSRLISAMGLPPEQCPIKNLTAEVRRQLLAYQFIVPKTVNAEEAHDDQLKMSAPPGDHDDGCLALVYLHLGLREMPKFSAEAPRYKAGTHGERLKEFFDELAGVKVEKEPDPFELPE